MTDDIDNWITTAQAGELLNITARRINALVKAGKLRARPINPRLTLVFKPDVEEYGRTRKPGKPPVLS